LCGENDSNNDEGDNINTKNNDDNSKWVWLSQDTINNGKPGKREKVWEYARTAILGGRSVIIDRMHLDPEQRKTTIENVVTDEMKDSNVNVHVVLLNPPKDLITSRVSIRTNHPGKVEGDHGVKLTLLSMNQLVVPTHKEEGLDLISCVSTEFSAKQLGLRYHRAFTTDLSNGLFESMGSVLVPSSSASTQNSVSSTLSVPSISLGTMKIGRRKGTEIVQKMITDGFHSLDTAPTYKNEDKIGEALKSINKSCDDIFIIAKVPKRATDSDQVQEEFENTLKNLNRKCVDLLLLHWPSDVIAQNTLKEVWDCMESFVKDGRCKALGVCNFNENALAKLLKCCTVPPVINQVERHPLLPQHSLVDFCARNNIVIQAHTTLGQGRDEILQNLRIVEIANDINCTPAQVLVQWNLQHGVLVVTKCSQEVHAKEILSIIDSSSETKKKNTVVLSPKHMKALDSLGNGTRFIAPPFMYGNAIYCWGERMPRM
jgi:diketogulonate reductase-like aldo/keto reductase